MATGSETGTPNREAIMNRDTFFALYFLLSPILAYGIATLLAWFLG